MERLKAKLENFMHGRNGADEMGRDIGIASIVIYFLSMISRNLLLYMLSLCGMFYSVFRMLSRKVQDRRRENWKYKSRIQKWKFKFGQHKNYRIFKCKGCGRRIRVPRGKGKVEITCPLCGKKIIRHT